MTPSPIIELN